MAGAWKDVAAGTVGGVAICAVGHPFDTLKVRLQTQGGSAAAPATLLYRNTWDCLVKTLKCASSSSTSTPSFLYRSPKHCRWEGIGGLYKGVASPLVGQMFFRACLFTCTLLLCVLFIFKLKI
jgi:solute carrier family 25 carnitine/acylcarnitine transporter 20/29